MTHKLRAGFENIPSNLSLSLSLAALKAEINLVRLKLKV
jgi:hypothetical protein